jgi:glycosyltransferase involved in cell wall biosynthesis
MGKKMKGFDLITTQDPSETGIVGLMLSRYLKVKLHVQVHTDFLSPYFVKEGLLNFLRVKTAGYVLPKADAIRVVSSRIKKSLKKYELKTEPVVLPILVELRSSKTELNLHAKYPGLKFILLTVSRLEKEKNISLAIEVAKALGQDFGLVIVGDGNLKKKLEKQAKGYNIFFEGWQNDLVPYYKTADCYLNTSNYEGYGLSLVEAVSNGLPVVSTDVGVSGDILVHKANSLICPVGDRKCLIESVASLNKELLSKFRDSNKKISKELSIGWYDYLEKYRKSWLKAFEK